MTSPLNPTLYDRLRDEFGRVVISQAGIAAAFRYGPGPFVSDNRIRMEMDTAGEYYRVCCPWCGDSRYRLWINYLWGVPDETTESRNLWLAVCYNEHCLERPGRVQELYERVYGFRNANLRGKQVVILPGAVEDQSLKEIKPPGLLLPLTNLPTTDRVIAYIRSRGLDPQTLHRSFCVSYVLNADSEYPMAQDRIYIPIFMHNMLVGWQCRYPADLDWKTARVPKYYSRPNMPRRLMLYNYDNAVRFPFVVVCEGPTDTWNVGPYAVATFGKSISFPQLKLLCDNWRDGAIVILLDGDAWEDAQKLANKIREAEYKGSIIPVRLPEDKDPGSLDQSVNADFIVGAAGAMGIDLLSLKRGEYAGNVGSGEGPQLSPASFWREVDGGPSDYSFDLPRDPAGRT